MLYDQKRKSKNHHRWMMKKTKTMTKTMKTKTTNTLMMIHHMSMLVIVLLSFLSFLNIDCSIHIPSVDASTVVTSAIKNPFSSKKTTEVTGFGAGPLKRSIFKKDVTITSTEPSKSTTTTTTTTEVDNDDGSSSSSSEVDAVSDPVDEENTDTIKNSTDDEQQKEAEEGEVVVVDNISSSTSSSDLIYTDAPKLWVRKVDELNELWLQEKHIDDDKNDETFSPTTTTTLAISSRHDNGELQIRDVVNDDDENGKTSSSTVVDSSEWVPIEGLFGMYKVPSGILFVLIPKTEPVYEAPFVVGQSKSSSTTTTASSSTSPTSSTSWWNIRRVTNFEIVHLSRPQTLLSPSMIKEELRQLRLLRIALKQHDFYLTSSSNTNGNGNVFTDMTRNLQDSIEENVERENDDTNDDDRKNTGWWEEEGRQPDPRFFWNQVAVEPFLNLYEENEPSIELEEHDNDDEVASKEESVLEQQKNRLHASMLLKHVIPITSAFVGIQTDVPVGNGITNMTYHQILISRRSRFRAGTRFTRRGADVTGAVANFVETEQICLAMNNRTNLVQKVMSHIQIRGSIPLRWSSPADVKTYRPKVRIGMDPLAQARALWLHLMEQYSYYTKKDRISVIDSADIVFVNLIDKKSDQGRLGRVFDAVLNAVMDVHANDTVSETEETKSRRNHRAKNNHRNKKKKNGNDDDDSTSSLVHQAQRQVEGPKKVDHYWYDFHAEVKGGNWDRLGILLNDLQPDLLDHGYFMADVVVDTTSTTSSKSFKSSSTADETRNQKSKQRWRIHHRQNAVIRTNCMDCLDRTNVVQSIMGRYMLFQQLKSVADDDNSNNDNNNNDDGARNNKKNNKNDQYRGTSIDGGENQDVDMLWVKYKKQFRKKNSLSLPWKEGEIAHRLLWADNADAISRLYAGTAALKGDFTRTGQRTKKGALDDGMNSLQRYYLNNFLDADRQEGMDLMVGYADFSNVGYFEDDEDDNEMEMNRPNDGEENSFMSLKDVTRNNLFSGLLDSLNGNNDDDDDKKKKKKNGNVGTREAKSERWKALQHYMNNDNDELDLRWIPGDLQSHVRSQAEEEEAADGDDNDTTGHRRIGDDEEAASSSTRGSWLYQLIDSMSEYSPNKALRAMDRRAASFLPWWAQYDEDFSMDDDEDIDDEAEEDPASSTSSKTNLFQTLLSQNGLLPTTTTTTTRATNGKNKGEEDDDDDAAIISTSSLSDLPISQHQREYTMNGAIAVGIFLVGLNAPIHLASAVVGFLSFVVLPKILMHDILSSTSSSVQDDDSSNDNE